MSDLKNIIHRAMERSATDVHLTVGVSPVFRIDGELVSDIHPPMTEADVRSAVEEICTPEQLKELEKVGDCDFAVTYENNIRMRCNTFRQQGYPAAALRLLPMQIPTIEELDIPKVVVNQADKLRGLVLVTGPTGSGKSSTLAALLNHINKTSKRHIITLENPIEYLHTHDKCIINQREIGRDTESFAAGLRAALRQDPDVVLVGEMRDLETISTAITAAETGHLVFGTLHTKGAANCIDRIIDVFPPEQQEQIRIQLADVLECVVTQTLVKKNGGGRVSVYEIMVAVPAIRSLIRQNKSFQIPSTMQTGRRQGMVLLDDALAEQVRNGVISVEAAMAVANEPAAIRALSGR